MSYTGWQLRLLVADRLAWWVARLRAPERTCGVATARDSAPVAPLSAEWPLGRDLIETSLLKALHGIAEHAAQYGPDADTKFCDQSCADEMVGIAEKALRRYEGDVQIGMG